MKSSNSDVRKRRPPQCVILSHTEDEKRSCSVLMKPRMGVRQPSTCSIQKAFCRSRSVCVPRLHSTQSFPVLSDLCRLRHDILPKESFMSGIGITCSTSFSLATASGGRARISPSQNSVSSLRSGPQTRPFQRAPSGAFFVVTIYQWFPLALYSISCTVSRYCFLGRDT